jgi:hypothetical protein
MTVLTRQEVFDAINQERSYQDQKWGVNNPQSLPGFLLIAKGELNEAIDGWIKNRQGRNSPLAELLQVAAVCVAAMERYGINGNTVNTDDVPMYGPAKYYQYGDLSPRGL